MTNPIKEPIREQEGSDQNYITTTMTLKDLLEDYNQELFDADYNTANPLDLRRFLTKIEDLL